VALRDALAQTEQDKPPNLRAAARPTSSCATCVYFKAKSVGGQGACRLHSGYPVRTTQVCDDFKRG
jgi:hypothetical protein